MPGTLGRVKNKLCLGSSKVLLFKDLVWCGMFLPQELEARYPFSFSRQERPVGEFGIRTKLVPPSLLFRAWKAPFLSLLGLLEGQAFFP